ncbi:MAG TPA: hypothetical protein VK524_25825, partial [Polyangiaceae bacterium]|nr:hypothetical protein [Polyangiaceae bacterium]
LPLLSCRKLSRANADVEFDALLEELEQRQICMRSVDSVRVWQEPLREHLLASVSEVELRELHVALGDALLADALGKHPENRLASANVRELGIALQAGWHLLHGGEDARGRELLRNAGIELTHRGDGFAETVPALEAALEAYRKQGRSRYECGYLMVPLTLAGNYVDWRLSYRYGDELLDMLAEVTGIALAARLARRLPARLALILGLLIALVLMQFSARRLIVRNFREALLGLVGLASAILGTCSSLLDAQRAERLARMLEPLRAFPARHPVRLVHDFQTALVHCSAGRYAEARTLGRQVLETLRKPDSVPGLAAGARAQIQFGAYVLVGNLDCHRSDGSVHETLAAIEQLNTGVARETAVNILANYHANRGERAKYEQFREELDVLAAQGGSTWRPDVLMPRALWWTYTLCEDVLGLKRSVGQLEVLAKDHPALEATRDAAHACYLAERGMADVALQRHAAMFESVVVGKGTLVMRFVGAYARILRAAGRPQRAKEVCLDALQRLSPEDLEFTGMSYSMRLELGLAMAELGDVEHAVSYLEELMAAQGQHDNALVHGLTHKALAEVALIRRDQEAFERHLARMQEWYGRTDNPALVGQCQRLAGRGREQGLLPRAALSREVQFRSEGEGLEINAAFNASRGPASRLQTALDLILQKTRAARGYLYLREPEGLRFAAPAVGFEPPEELLKELSERVATLSDDDLETEEVDPVEPDELKTVIQTDQDRLSIRPPDAGGTYRALPLITGRNQELVVVGIVALVQEGEALVPVNPLFLQEIARNLYDSGDVRTAYLQVQPRPS